jgi:hypothetical protein
MFLCSKELITKATVGSACFRVNSMLFKFPGIYSLQVLGTGEKLYKFGTGEK